MNRLFVSRSFWCLSSLIVSVYSDYCAAAFKTRTLGDHIVTFTREGNVAFGCDVEV